MTYIPLLHYGEGIYAFFVYYLILAVFGSILTIKIYSKYFDEKNPATLYLLLVFTSFMLSLYLLIIGMAEAIVTGYYMEIYRTTIPIAYSMLIIGIFFLYLFANHFISSRRKIVFLLLISGIIIILVHFLPCNYWGVPKGDYEGQVSIRLYTTASLLIYSSAVCLSIFVMCQKNRKREKNKTTRLRLSLLSYAMICIICFLLFMVIETINIVIFRQPGYSIYNYLAWIFVIFFFIFSYISLFTPARLIMWIKKRNE